MTGLLHAWRHGDRAALDHLVPLVERELNRIARGCLLGERANHSLSATALVNEAFLRLVDVRQIDWQDRAHFLSMAARLMRRILVDFARARGAGKRGGDAVRLTLDEARHAGLGRAADVVRLDEALQALASQDPRKSQVVEMKFFAGLETDQIAAALDVSPKTVLRDWQFAKAWLQREMADGTPS